MWLIQLFFLASEPIPTNQTVGNTKNIFNSLNLSDGIPKEGT